MSLSESTSCYNQYKKRVDCEKSTQTSLFACPHCSKEFGSIPTSESQSDDASSQQQTEDQLEQSSGRTDVTGLSPDQLSPKSSEQLEQLPVLPLKEPKPTTTIIDNASGYKPRNNGKPPRYPQPMQKEIPMEYQKQSVDRKSKSKMVKVLKSPVSEGSLQKLGVKHMYDFPDKDYVSTAATEPCAPINQRKQKPQQSFRNVATETSLQSIDDKSPKESEHGFAVSQDIRKQILCPPIDLDIHTAQAGRVIKKGRKPSRNIEQEPKPSATNKEPTESKPTQVHTCKKSKVSQTQSKQRHGRQAVKDGQLTTYKGKRAKEPTSDGEDIRDKIVDDLLYYKNLHDATSMSTDSSSMLCSLDDDMAKLFDLYATTTPTETTQTNSGSQTESLPMMNGVKERHYLPSLGLPSPAQRKQETPKCTKAEHTALLNAIRQGPKFMNLLNLTPQDLIDTHVTAPMIRRVQRIYRANLAEQMLLVQELDSIPKLVREMLDKLHKK